jgi:hypothetical protein
MPSTDELELVVAALEREAVDVRDVFRLGEWVVALGTRSEDPGGLGDVSPVGWNLKVADGKVREVHAYDSWSRALELAAGWGGWADAAGGEEARSADRPFDLNARTHPHRAPSIPSVGDTSSEEST